MALRTAGLIKEVSLGMNSVGYNEVGEDRAANVLRLIKGAPIGTFDSALHAYGYNLFNQDGVEILQECEARGIAVHVCRTADPLGPRSTSAQRLRQLGLRSDR